MERKLNRKLVRETAEKAGLSITELAQKVGVSPVSVTEWLSGKSVPRPGASLRLGRVLALTYEQMFGAKDQSLEPQVTFRHAHNRPAVAKESLALRASAPAQPANRNACSASPSGVCEPGRLCEERLPPPSLVGHRIRRRRRARHLF